MNRFLKISQVPKRFRLYRHQIQLYEIGLTMRNKYTKFLLITRLLLSVFGCSYVHLLSVSFSDNFTELKDKDIA